MPRFVHLFHSGVPTDDARSTFGTCTLEKTALAELAKARIKGKFHFLGALRNLPVVSFPLLAPIVQLKAQVIKHAENDLRER
jgi:hypothetical protein